MCLCSGCADVAVVQMWFKDVRGGVKVVQGCARLCRECGEVVQRCCVGCREVVDRWWIGAEVVQR